MIHGSAFRLVQIVKGQGTCPRPTTLSTIRYPDQAAKYDITGNKMDDKAMIHVGEPKETGLKTVYVFLPDQTGFQNY